MIDTSKLKQKTHAIQLLIVSKELKEYYKFKVGQLDVDHSLSVKYYSLLNNIKQNVHSSLSVIKGLIKEKLFLFSFIKNLFFLFKSVLFNKSIVINLEEHIGDLVACEPVSRIIKDNNKNSTIIWITKYSFQRANFI